MLILLALIVLGDGVNGGGGGGSTVDPRITRRRRIAIAVMQRNKLK